LTCYSGFEDKRAQQTGSSRSEQTALPTFEELAAQQGVAPIHDFEALLGKSTLEDESAKDFSASLRQWRREGSLPASSQ
jgi:hypothetical protein